MLAFASCAAREGVSTVAAGKTRDATGQSAQETARAIGEALTFRGLKVGRVAIMLASNGLARTLSSGVCERAVVCKKPSS